MMASGDKANRWVKLNVGGKIFLTARTTLASYPDSFLYRICQEDTGLETDKDEFGAYLIDRNPNYFPPILDFMRHGELIMDAHLSEEGVLKEAEFFGLTKLAALLQLKKEQKLKWEEKWVKLNVGGTTFLTTRSTLKKYPSSLTYLKHDKDDFGAYLIEGNPNNFGPILNFMVRDNFIMDGQATEEGVLKEAEFFELYDLVRLIKSARLRRRSGTEMRSFFSKSGQMLAQDVKYYLENEIRANNKVDEVIYFPNEGGTALAITSKD